jgi:hypothetical protein
MTDQEMIALAARGAGITHDGVGYVSPTGLPTNWNPLADDGDALRLAVKLEIQVGYSDFIGEAEAKWNRGFDSLAVYGPDDPCAATRRAIVRAAAIIGEQLATNTQS